MGCARGKKTFYNGDTEAQRSLIKKQNLPPRAQRARKISIWKALYGRQLAEQAIGERMSDSYGDIVAGLGFGVAVQDKVQRLVLGGATDELAAGRVLPFHHDFQNLSDMAAGAGALNFALVLLQDLEATGLFGVGNGGGVLQRGEYLNEKTPS